MQKFSSTELESIKQKLEAEKTQLYDRIHELEVQDPFSDPDRLTDNAASDAEATEESSHDRYAAMIDELNVQLTAVDKALFRIQDGTYGVCTSCGTVIDIHRLKLLPYAQLCLSCEKKK